MERADLTNRADEGAKQTLLWHSGKRDERMWKMCERVVVILYSSKWISDLPGDKARRVELTADVLLGQRSMC